MTEPLALNCHSISGIVCFAFAAILGLASIISTARSNDPDNYNWEAAKYAAIALGSLCIIMGVTAYSCTFKAARQYMDQRDSTSPKGFMIASWIIFAIFILNGILLIALGVSDDDVATGWVVSCVFWGLVGWGLMFVYQEKARKSTPSQQVLPTTKEHTVAAPSHPSGAMAASHYPPMEEEAQTYVTIETTINEDGTRSIKTIRRSVNPDGTITIEERVEEAAA